MKKQCNYKYLPKARYGYNPLPRLEEMYTPVSLLRSRKFNQYPDEIHFNNYEDNNQKQIFEDLDNKSYVNPILDPREELMTSGYSDGFFNYNKQDSYNNPIYKPKRVFGTPNINAILGFGLLTQGLQTYANNVDNNRQQDYINSQYNNMLYSDLAPINGQSFNVKYGYSKYGGMLKNFKNEKLLNNYNVGGLINKCYDELGNEVPCVSEEDDNRRVELAKTIVQNAKKRIENGNYIEVPENLKEIAKKNNKFANSCIGGVCTVLKESGAIPKVIWSNTEFALKTKDFNFSNNGKPVKGIDNLEEGDVLQYLDTDTLNTKKAYPHHAQILVKKGDENNDYEFFDNFRKTLRSYSKEVLTDLLRRDKKVDEHQANIYKINPYNSNTISQQAIFKKTQESVKNSSSFDSYTRKGINDDLKNYPAYYMGDIFPTENAAKNNLKDKLISYFNNEELDKKIQKSIGISASDLSNIKPLVYGMFGQETNFGNPKSDFASSKYTLENLYSLLNENTKMSIGIAQIKQQYIPENVKKDFDIKGASDLNDILKAYVSATAVINNGKKYVNNIIQKGQHPELKNKDEFERAMYWINSPVKVVKKIPEEEKNKYDLLVHTDQNGNYVENPSLSNITDKDALNYYNKYYLNIDKGSYPYKILQAASDLEQHFDLTKSAMMPEVVVKTTRKKKKYGGFLNKFEDGGNTDDFDPVDFLGILNDINKTDNKNNEQNIVSDKDIEDIQIQEENKRQQKKLYNRNLVMDLLNTPYNTNDYYNNNVENNVPILYNSNIKNLGKGLDVSGDKNKMENLFTYAQNKYGNNNKIYGINEMVWNPMGGYDNGTYNPKINWKNHDDHIHFGFENPNVALDIINKGKELGLNTTENYYTGDVHNVHAKNSFHYKKFKKGGVYDLTPEEIENLRKKGYNINIL